MSTFTIFPLVEPYNLDRLPIAGWPWPPIWTVAACSLVECVPFRQDLRPPIVMTIIRRNELDGADFMVRRLIRW